MVATVLRHGQGPRVSHMCTEYLLHGVSLADDSDCRAQLILEGCLEEEGPGLSIC